jgi:glycosyltransferase involved in cell wall biosynthesis
MPHQVTGTRDLKVLHLVQSQDVNIGGSLTVGRALVKEQRSIGVDAWLVVLYCGRAVTTDAEQFPFEITCNVRRSSRWTKGIKTLRRLIVELSPDIIHHHDGILWPRLAGMGLGIPRVTHGHLGAPPLKFPSLNSLTHLVTLHTTQHLIAISKWVADSWRLSGMDPSRISIVPNGVDTNRFFRRPDSTRHRVRNSLGLEDSDLMLAWVGRMDKLIKGLDRLMEVAAHLSPLVRLVILGDGPDLHWLNDQVKQFPPETRPIVLGKVEDPSEILGCADAFLFTSRLEPFGLVILEAVSSSLPIYAFPCDGGVCELFSRFKVTNEDNNGVHYLANAILKHGRGASPQLRSIAADEFSWPSVARQIVDLYLNILIDKVKNL